MESTTTRVYEAILKGEISQLINLLKEDPLILNRCMIQDLGRLVQSPLHVAAEMGRLDIVRKLIELNPSMCLALDQEGRNPIQVAAIKGQTDVLRELHCANRRAAQEKTYNGETILHLCVKYNQLRALEILVELTSDDGDQLIDSKDNNGNTILHFAVTDKQSEIVDYLCKLPRIPTNAMNLNKMTAVDIYLKQNEKGFEDERIKQSLKRVKAKPAKDALSGEAEETWLANQSSALMVVASLIATMAFQAGINPPGGVWQETIDGPNGHAAGDAIWSYYDGDDTYREVLISNTIGFISSLSVILLLISGLPFKRYFLSILRVILWISVTATSYTYVKAIKYVTEDDNSNFVIVLKAVQFSIFTWIGVVTIIFFGNVVRLVNKVMGWQRRQVIKRYCKNHCCTARDDAAAAADVKMDVNNRLDLEVPN